MDIDWDKILQKMTNRTISTDLRIETVDESFRGIEPGEIYLPSTNGYSRYVKTNPCAELQLSKNGFLPPATGWGEIEPIYDIVGFKASNNLFNNIYNEKYEGGNKMFNLEDELKIVKSEYVELLDRVGIVRDIVKKEDGSKVYGLEIKDLKVGHNMDGKCKNGDGWYVVENELELVNKSKLCRMIVKDEEILMKLRGNEEIQMSTDVYSVRKNGALTFLTCEGRKVFVYKDGASLPLILNCISEDDRIVTLHLMEVLRILPMYTITAISYKLEGYTQEHSDRLENTMFPMESPEAIKLIEEIKELATNPEEPVIKVYTSEEELYAELGITKKD